MDNGAPKWAIGVVCVFLAVILILAVAVLRLPRASASKEVPQYRLVAVSQSETTMSGMTLGDAECYIVHLYYADRHEGQLDLAFLSGMHRAVFMVPEYIDGVLHHSTYVEDNIQRPEEAVDLYLAGKLKPWESFTNPKFPNAPGSSRG